MFDLVMFIILNQVVVELLVVISHGFSFSPRRSCRPFFSLYWRSAPPIYLHSTSNSHVVTFRNGLLGLLLVGSDLEKRV